jgi:hypothetical protein
MNAVIRGLGVSGERRVTMSYPAGIVISSGAVLAILLILLTAGCATSGTAETMIHPGLTGDTLAAERKLAIDRCEHENTPTETTDYRNAASMDARRGIAQQSRRISAMAAFDEAVIACMRRNGWRFP